MIVWVDRVRACITKGGKHEVGVLKLKEYSFALKTIKK